MRWWQIRKRDADVERELQSDLELEEEEQREHGVPPEEARHAAMRSFGNRTLISEQTRAVWSWNGLESLLRDLRISVRTLFRSPGFSIIAVLVMALCIGATTSLFTVVRSVLLSPLPFRDPDRLVMIFEHFRDPSRSEEHTSELQSPCNLVCRLLLEKKKRRTSQILHHQGIPPEVRNGGPTLPVSTALIHVANRIIEGKADSTSEQAL